MAPETHLLASWVIGAKGTDNARDCRLVALPGILPDLDGIGLLADGAAGLLGYRTHFYAQYHHYLLHGVLGAVLLAGLMGVLARRHWRVALLALLVFHLHILFDLVGSRGPSAEDLWPVFYFGPFDKDPMWIWKGQWRLDGWQNRWFSAGLLFAALWMAVPRGYSFVGLFNRRLDAVFVGVLQKWHAQWLAWKKSRGQPE